MTGAGRGMGRALLPPALVLLAVGLGVEAAKAAGLLPVTVPAPSQVAALAPAALDDLVYHGSRTVRSAVTGYAVAAGLALALASVALAVRALERPIVSMAVLVDCIPLIAIAPIFVIWIGQGPHLHVTVAAISAFFPLLIGSVQGFRAIDRNMEELFHVIAASRWQRLWKLAVPSALPYLFAALKIAAPLALLGTLIAEWMGTDRGLGAMIVLSLFSFDVPRTWLTILTVCGLSALAYGLIALVESRVVTWTGPADGGLGGR